MAGRSDMAIVRSLRDGRRHQVAVRAPILHEDAGIRRDPATYPDLTKVRVKRQSRGPVTLPARARRRPALSANLPGTSQRRLASR
jgi:hypothetical protein